MEHQVTFQSDGLTLTGVVHTPDDMEPGERRPAIMVLHGFGSNKSSGNSITPAEMFCDWGYVTMRFDFRGCGDSEGEYGRIICLEQVADTRNALSYLQTRDDVDPDRIGAVGSSFGAAVAVYTGGVDERLAAVLVAWLHYRSRPEATTPRCRIGASSIRSPAVGRAWRLLLHWPRRGFMASPPAYYSFDFSL